MENEKTDNNMGNCLCFGSIFVCTVFVICLSLSIAMEHYDVLFLF